MNYKSALIFCVAYFLLSYLAIAIEGILDDGNFVAAANIAALVIAIRISIFKEWLTAGSSWGVAVAWSLFCACITVIYLHTLPYVAGSVFSTSFERLGVTWTVGLFGFNLLVSIGCLKFYSALAKESKGKTDFKAEQ